MNMIRVVILLVVLMTLVPSIRTCATKERTNSHPIAGTSKLVKLVIIFRHGDRTPIATYPTDPYPFTDRKFWPDGPGQLTANGKKRMLHLGQLIREKYNNFLGENPFESYVRSSAVDRCVASAELVMTGVYANDKKEKIVIHTRNRSTDGMLGDQEQEKCDAGKTAAHLQLSAHTTKAYADKNRDVIKKVEKGSGTAIRTIADVAGVFDTLLCDKQAGKGLPGWVITPLFAQMKQISDVSLCVTDSGKFLQRLDAGLFLHELEQVFKSVVVDGHIRKAFFYSTHDTRLIPILKAMRAFDGFQPKYGSSIVFEMHEVSGHPFIRVFHLKDPHELRGNLVQLKTRGCPKDGDCSVQQFFSGLREFITDEETHRKECATKPEVAQEVDCRF